MLELVQRLNKINIILIKKHNWIVLKCKPHFYQIYFRVNFVKMIFFVITYLIMIDKLIFCKSSKIDMLEPSPKINKIKSK